MAGVEQQGQADIAPFLDPHLDDVARLGIVGDRADQPGYAKAAMSFLVRAEGTGSRLITETRIHTTDPASGRSFRRYWRLVRPGSGLIRRSWLAAVRSRLARR